MKKQTIKNALKCCGKSLKDCCLCPLYGFTACQTELARQSFALISRLENENEEYRAINESLKEDNLYYITRTNNAENLANAQTVIITDLHGEIERLQELLKGWKKEA